MSTLKVSKVLSALPGTLVANMIYLVRVGTGFDLYATDSTGSLAYKSNAPSSNTPVTALSIVSGVVTVNLSLGDYFTVAMNANATLAFSNPPAAGTGRTVDVTVTQPTTGGPYTLILPASMHAIGASDTAIQSAANAKTKIIVTTLDAGTTYAYSMAKVA